MNVKRRQGRTSSTGRSSSRARSICRRAAGTRDTLKPRRRDHGRGHRGAQRQPSGVGQLGDDDRHRPRGAARHAADAAAAAARRVRRRAGPTSSRGSGQRRWRAAATGRIPTSTVLVENGVDVAMDQWGLLKNVADAPRWRRCSRGRWRSIRTAQRRFLQDDPSFINCKPPGGPRQFQQPLRRAVRGRPGTAAHFRADRRRQQQLTASFTSTAAARRGRSAATTTTRSTTAGRWENGRATRWWSIPGGSTRTSGSPTAGCRTPTSCS